MARLRLQTEHWYALYQAARQVPKPERSKSLRVALDAIARALRHQIEAAEKAGKPAPQFLGSAMAVHAEDILPDYLGAVQKEDDVLEKPLDL